MYKIPLRTKFLSGKLYILEYLLLEHRTRSGLYYNRHLPVEGLLIWHINPEGSNEVEEEKEVDLVCADGLYRDAGYPLGAEPHPYHGGDNLDFWAHDDTYTQAYQG